MTTTGSRRRSSQQSINPPRIAAALVAILLAVGLGTAAFTPATAQDAATPEATPTLQQLEQILEQAIAEGVEELTVPLQEFNDSGIEGTATFFDLGDETLIRIDVEGIEGAAPAFILQGTCGETEPEPVERLTPVDETGETLSLIDRSLTELLEGNFTIELRLSPTQLGVLAACANIEGIPVPATPVDATPAAETPTAVPTGEGGRVETPTPTPAGAGVAAVTPTPTVTPGLTPPPAVTPAVTPVVGGKGTTIDGTGGADVAPETVASLPLDDYSGLGVTGTLSLLALDDVTTKVKITLSGDAVTGGHIAHLHPGTCDNLQDEGTIYLASVGADEISETTVGVPLDQLLAGGWSVNVHPSEDQWDTWLVCGSLGNATAGMTGVIDVTPVVGGKGASVRTGTTDSGTGVGGAGDGTSGVSGKGEPAQTSTLTQGVGVGSTLLWPDSPSRSIASALGVFALLLTGAGIALRHGRRTDRPPARWQRLGL